MAGDYIITGGRPLNGTVRVPAAKNSVLPLLAASLLCSGPVRLCGVPELADVAESLALLRSAGCTAERQGADVRVDGVFHLEEKDPSLRFRGSRNQRIIDVKKTLETGETVLWDGRKEP